jgi:glycosyltransferase involved in cell wall biosynthesis
MPKVSVVMSVYNGERHLRQAVDSILCQTFTDFEFIIVDDGSTDRTPEILANYADERLVVIRQPHAGLSSALNRGIQIASAPYIARMDADDIALPERLEQQLAYLEAHPEVGLLGSWVYLINEQGEIIGQLSFPTDSNEIRRRMIVRNLLIHPTVMMRRELVIKAGLYDKDCRYVEDYDLWFRMLSLCLIANLPIPLLKYRISETATTAKRQREMVKNALKVRWRAIRTGLYPWSATIYLIPPFLTLILPPNLSYILRRKWLLWRSYRIA